MHAEDEKTLTRDLAGALLARKFRMATAESCTGGWVAKCCTDQAGSSGWFERGFVTYSDEAKMEMLQVERSALRHHGAVSEIVARQMADGARREARVEVAMAITGIAGPAGGSLTKPVGTVWFAWSVASFATSAECRVFGGDRESIRLQAVIHALRGLVQRVSIA